MWTDLRTIWCAIALLMRSSNLKLQALQASRPGKLERKATACSEYQQEVFYLQEELAEVICARPQETCCAGLVRFNECKDSSSLSKLPIVPTCIQETQACAVTYVRLNQCKDYSSFHEPAWYRRTSMKTEWIDRVVRIQQSNTENQQA